MLARQCIRALRYPRGRYSTDRASQLSGVPASTLRNWRRAGSYVPDFDSDRPMWSYRDLILIRMVAWLRQNGLTIARAGEYALVVRGRFAAGENPQQVMATHRSAVIDDELFDPVRGDGFLPYDNLPRLLSVFEIQASVEDLGRKRLWAPDLVMPSSHTYISPWMLGGAPCVRRSRIPTATVYALRRERELTTPQIVELYPGLEPEAADDAHELESRLRGTEPVAA